MTTLQENLAMQERFKEINDLLLRWPATNEEFSKFSDAELNEFDAAHTGANRKNHHQNLT